MITRICSTFVAALVIGLAPAPVARADVSNARVEAAIKKARAFLYAQQKNGHWELAPQGKFANDNDKAGGQWGGLTALNAYALLAAGEDPQDPKMAAAIDFLKKSDVRGTYAVGLRMQVWLLLPPTKETAALMKVDAANLLAMTQGEGTARGMHDYTAIGGKGYSHSRSQYAVLGAWAAEQMIPETVPSRYWTAAEEGWINNQDASGGWTYKHPRDTPIPVTPGMTAAGVASLFITQDYLHSHKAVDCRGNVSNPAIDKGVAWLAKNFDKVATDEKYDRDFPYISLYAVERVGVAGGLKYFGTHDWYDKGANWILKNQKADGSWSTGEGHAGPLVDTPFAMLFLVRGRAPVAFSKVDYSAPPGPADPKKPNAPPAAWNQRPRDIANVVRWVGKQLERDLNWQVVNLNVEAEELLDTTTLYLSGSQPLALTDAQAQRLKSFVEMGGLVVGHADCATGPASPFAKSFRELGQKLFPASEFRDLPPTSPVLNSQFRYAAWKVKPQVQGLSNGARELMLLIHAGDPARLWQTRAYKGREEAWQLMANVFLYTNDQKDLRYKGDTHWVVKNDKVTPTRKLSVARLQYAGNWDPEPAGWRRLAAILNNRHDLALTVDTLATGEGKLNPATHKVAHLTGTTRWSPPDEVVAELRKYVAGGGLLILDAAGGAGDFAESAEALAKALDPEGQPKLLPAEHAVYKAADGQPLAVEYRAAARKHLGTVRTGRLLGVEADGRVGVVVSREDLSVGLVGQNVDGVVGYAPDTATALMVNLVNSAAPKPTTKPATKPAGTPAAKPAAKPPAKPAGEAKPKPKPAGGEKKDAPAKK